MQEKNTNQEELFSTTDLNTATVLLATNNYYVGLKPISSNQYSFSFKKTDYLEETLKSYINSELRINPRALFEAYRLLKQKVEEARRS